MSRHKLIAVEGIPGAGKTTMAIFVQQRLDRHGRSSSYPCCAIPISPTWWWMPRAGTGMPAGARSLLTSRRRR
jgi:hypothetical protein